MSQLILPRRFTEQPQYSFEVDWSHPLFEGATDATIIIGGQPSIMKRGGLFHPINISGTYRAPVASVQGLAWYATGVSNQFNLAPVIPRKTTALQVAIGSARIRTKGSAGGAYLGYQTLGHGIVIFGGASTAYREYSWAGGNVQLVRPAAAISSAPSVWVDGKDVIVSAVAGTASSYDWGDSNTWWEIGRHPANTNSQNDYAYLTVFVDWDVPDRVAREVTVNPWGIFLERPQVRYIDVGGTTVAPGAGGYTFAGNTPTISQPHTVAPAAGAVVALGYAPSLAQGASVAPGAGAVTYAGQAPSIAQPHTVAPSAGAVVALGYAPSIQQAAGIYPGAGEVVYTGQAPTVSQPNTVSPGVGAYDILGYAPTVSQAAGVAPLAGSIIILGYAPSIAQPHTVAPGAGAAAWLGYEPTISQIASSFTEAQLQEILAYVEANMAVPTTSEIAAAVWAEILSGSSAADRLVGMAAAILAAAQAAPIHANVVDGQTDIADAVWSKTLP